MNVVLRFVFLVGMVGAALCANSAEPIVLTPNNDPRVASFQGAVAPTQILESLRQAINDQQFPLTVLPHPEDATLSTATANARFGFSVAISGNWAVVGAPGMDGGTGPNTGRAYVFRRVNHSFTYQATLAAADGLADDWFGYAVAVDGDRVVVTANRDDLGAVPQVGSAYVFEWDGAAWLQVAKLQPTQPIGDTNYGFSVVLNGDELMVGAVGAMFQQPNVAGAVYTYKRINNVWTLQGLIGPENNQQAQWFGYDLALQNGVLIVGAPLKDTLQADTGGAYAFSKTADTWTQIAELVDPSATSGDWYGAEVTISSQVVAISAPLRSRSAQNTGAVMLHERSMGSVAPVPFQTLIAPTQFAFDFFGRAIAADGRSLWIGMPAQSQSPTLFEYRWQDGQWLSLPPYSPSNTPTRFGQSVAVHSGVIAVGAPSTIGANSNQPNVGVVHLLGRNATITTQSGPGGALQPSGAVMAPIGLPFSLLVAPALGYHPQSVSGCGGSLVDMAFVIASVEDDCTITASFANDPPQATAITAQSGKLEGETWTLELTANDADPEPLSYSFDCDGNGSFEIGPQSSKTGQCVVSSAGSYSAVARVSDAFGGSASLSTGVTIGNSQPVITLLAPAAVDEDMPLIVTTTASVPSTGEQIATVALDCSYDGVGFVVDVSANTAGALQCPGYALSGPKVIAVRATDNEGEHSTIASTTVSVNAINDPPTFSFAGHRDIGPAAMGNIVVANVLTSVSVGPPDEQAQQIVAYDLQKISDPSSVVTSYDIDLQTGALHLNMQGQSGTATFSLSLTDNGVGGQPTSAPQVLTVTNLPGTDLQVSIDDARGQFMPGDSVEYEVLVGNAGPNQADARLNMPVPDGLTSLQWTCTVMPGAICPAPASGNGAIQADVTLARLGAARFIVTATVSGQPGGFVNATATLNATDDNAELDASNNSATDTNAVVGTGIFANSFEQTSSTLPMLSPEDAP